MIMDDEFTRLCFVIMPFSSTDSATEDEWTDFFLNDLKPAVEDAGLGYECRRSEASRGNIVRDILRDLQEAHVVIADLTDRNPNVFYELAVRHVLKPRTILITRDRSQVPSDLLMYGCLEYKLDRTQKSHQKLRDELRRLLAEVDEHPDKPDSPIADFLLDRRLAVEELTFEQQIRQCISIRRELIMATGKLRFLYRQAKEGNPESIGLMQMPGLSHLIATSCVTNDALVQNALWVSGQIDTIVGRGSVPAEWALHRLLWIAVFKKQVELVLHALNAGLSAASVPVIALPVGTDEIERISKEIEMLDDPSDWDPPMSLVIGS